MIELKLDGATLQMSHASSQAIVDATKSVKRIQQADDTRKTTNFKTKIL